MFEALFQTKQFLWEQPASSVCLLSVLILFYPVSHEGSVIFDWCRSPGLPGSVCSVCTGCQQSFAWAAGITPVPKSKLGVTAKFTPGNPIGKGCAGTCEVGEQTRAGHTTRAAGCWLWHTGSSGLHVPSLQQLLCRTRGLYQWAKQADQSRISAISWLQWAARKECRGQELLMEIVPQWALNKQ